MKKKLIKAALIFFGVLLVIVLYLLATFWDGIQLFMSKYNEKQARIQQNIYAVHEPVSYSLSETQHIAVTYMICQPQHTEDALEKQIHQFLEEHDVVESVCALTINKGLSYVVDVTFIKPSEDYPAGYYWAEPTRIPLYEDSLLCEVKIDLQKDGLPQYVYLKT